ncbi:MAG: FUSC family protein [Aeromicrobium sp.]
MGVFTASSPGKVWDSLWSVVASWSSALRTAVVRASPEREVALLIIKAAVATVIAWQFALRVLESSTPYYAPLAALLVVDRTLVRSLWASTQRLIAVVVGMSVAWLIGSTAGVHWWSMLVVLLVALLISRWRAFGDHGVQVPTMVLLSLLTVGGTSESFTYMTILETLAGGAIGFATNAVFFAPLHVDQPRESVSTLTHRVRELLSDISQGIRTEWDEEMAIGWYRSSTDIIHTAPEVREHVSTGHESTKFNPRDNFRKVQIDWSGYAHTVDALVRTQTHVSGIVSALVDAANADDPQPWPSPAFLSTYADALTDIGSAVSHFGRDEEGEQDAVRENLDHASKVLDDLEARIHRSPLDDPRAWPAYGALLIDAKRMIRELRTTYEKASVPTGHGPVRKEFRWRPWS